LRAWRPLVAVRFESRLARLGSVLLLLLAILALVDLPSIIGRIGWMPAPRASQ